MIGESLGSYRIISKIGRDGMVADTLDPLGIYFGTRSGDIYASIDEGKNWKKILEGLPAVVYVRVAQVGK